MTNDIEVDYLGCTVSCNVYIGDGGNDDPNQCEIESVGFEMLGPDGARIFARLPKDLEDKLCEQEWFFEAVELKAICAAENAE